MKAFRITAAALSGGLFTALQFAVHFLLLAYVVPPGNGLQRPAVDWAIMFTLFISLHGFMLGFAFGFLLGVLNSGPILGTLLGTVAGSLYILWSMSATELLTLGPAHALLLISFVSASGVMGLLTSQTPARFSRWLEEYQGS
jgi:hypothetical protein